jgi:putative oxidoreductase
MDVIHLASHGFGAHDLALALVRITVGLFFAISGYHKLANKDRHDRLVQTLTKDNVPYVKFMQWWVPFWELTAGALLVIGLFTAFSAGVLIIICLVACACEARKTVASYAPIDFADMVDDYLYLPEVLYIALLSVNVLAGGGSYSIDSLLRWS